MHPAPSCSALGPQCRGIQVTLRIATLHSETESADHEATWLLGHTDKMTFANLRRSGADLLVDAALQVRCRFLKPADGGSGRNGSTSRCAAHGFTGPTLPVVADPIQPRRLADDRFLVVQGHELNVLRLVPPPRSLPVLEDDLDNINPCSIAPCATADHTRGSACCRDLQIEILCPRADTALEALVRSRLSPYLCKVSRESEDALEAEMISACGFLDDDGENCTLHGRERPDGRPAKPDLCSHWPDDGKGLHPGCIFYSPPTKRSKQRQ